MSGRAGSDTGHAMARIGTTATGLDALVHLADLFATIRTLHANLSAHAAGQGVQVGAAQHEIGCRLADLGAVDHQPKVLWFSVLAAHLQTMVHRHLQAHAMAI